jgi:hypothetical protein
MVGGMGADASGSLPINRNRGPCMMTPSPSRSSSQSPLGSSGVSARLNWSGGQPQICERGLRACPFAHAAALPEGLAADAPAISSGPNVKNHASYWNYSISTRS